jgi:23S rRNA (adenine2030-N6)-methyltransferase
MNYRHIYHAGNFADVMKHFILTLLLQKLCEKDKPFFVLDTHAGIGKYDLTEEAAQKTKEYEEGISQLMESPQAEIFQPYLDVVKAMNADGAFRFYPGSPMVIKHFLRGQDKMALCELHPADYETLKQNLVGVKQALVRHEDAYTALRAFLPPKEKRGLVLIDPPFEKKDEFEQLIKGLKEAYRRFSTGIYAIWFPIKNRPPIDSFYEALTHSGIEKILVAEFLIAPADTPERLNGCGIVFINPPWQLDTMLQESLPVLLHNLGKDQSGAINVYWLVPEKN